MSEKIVQLNEEIIKGELKELVRSSVEEISKVSKYRNVEKRIQAERESQQPWIVQLVNYYPD
jgi:putative transposase